LGAEDVDGYQRDADCQHGCEAEKGDEPNLPVTIVVLPLSRLHTAKTTFEYMPESLQPVSELLAKGV
jgi:hypothetical protein